MTHTMTAALAERARLGVTLALFATSRGIEATGSGDRRYAYAADAIKRIAGTLDQVGDEVLMRLATVNEISNGTLSSLMSARLAEVGFALPTYPDARGFSSHSSSRLMRYCTALASASTEPTSLTQINTWQKGPRSI